jgi:23S rRNA (cytidine1920-2'-O)/16S rRNA (cytidine1409-2'-O)-methyltransferase
VIPLEGVNARYLEPALLPWPPDFVVVDVSFISLDRVLPPVRVCLGSGAEALTLVKPQFEVGRGKVPRGGIVRDPEQHRLVLERLASVAVTLGFGVLALCASALRGAEGNLEYFLHLRVGETGLTPAILAERIAAAVPDAADLAP